MTCAAVSADRSAEQAADSRPVKLATRGGIVAHAITHPLIGLLALQLALGGGGR